jgi:hypothetical protein
MLKEGELERMLERLALGLEDLLDPELTREEVIHGIKELSAIANEEDDEEEEGETE